MWVQIKGIDENGFYIGTIENEPHHAAAKLEDAVRFHPLHVAATDND